MRTGTPYVRDGSPEVEVAFFNISLSQIGNIYSNYTGGGLDKRLVYAKYKSEPYSGKGTIRLRNDDGGLNSVDFFGALCIISWGYHTGTKSVEEPLWVVAAQIVTEEGILYVELSVVNAWEMLKYSKGLNVADAAGDVPSTNRGWLGTDDILTIITDIVTDANGFLAQWGYTTVTQLSDDGIIGTYMPIVNTRLGDSDATLIRRLLQMTQSGMTFRSDTGVTINYIDPATPGPYYEYRNDGIEHPFFVGDLGSALAVPNRVIFLDIEPDSRKAQTFNYFGYAEDTVSMSRLGELAEIFYDDTIASDAEATARAEQMMARIISEAQVTQFQAPMNCCQELFDEIKITDDRNSSIVFIGRIGQIERIFIAEADNNESPDNRGHYICNLWFGGMGGGSTKIKSDIDGSNDIDATTTDLKTRSLKDPFIDTPQIDQSVLSQHYAPILTIDTCSSLETCNDGSVHTITGCSRTFTPLVDSFVKVTACFYLTEGAGVAAGDLFICYLYLNGSQQGQGLGRIAYSASGGGSYSKSWIVPVFAGISYTLDLRGQRQTGTGTWFISNNLTDMICEHVGARNVDVS